MTEETTQIRELARDFARAELRPHVEAWDRDAALPADVLAQIAELGFFGMLVPEEHGGMGFGLPAYVAALEELAWGEAGVALSVAISSIAAEVLLRHGSAEQKTAWLERIAAGSALACYAFSDADAAITRAERRGDQWVLTGEKPWVTGARSAQLALVLARTGSDAEPALFLVPMDAAGVSVGRRETTMGLKALDIAPLRLEDVSLGEDALVGGPGTGAQAAEDALLTGRLGIAAISLGIAQAALDHARGYAAEREQFGRAIRNFEAIQLKLADMAIRIAASRALLQEAAQQPDASVAAMAKVFASAGAMQVTTEAVQVYGG